VEHNEDLVVMIQMIQNEFAKVFIGVGWSETISYTSNKMMQHKEISLLV
jgi:hypothetical protein